MEIKDILKRPIITEKSMKDAALGYFTFAVDKRAIKPEIKNVVEKLFGVNVLKVYTMQVSGKVKKVGKRKKTVKKQDFKKAIVLLKKGQKIELFETQGKNA